MVPVTQMPSPGRAPARLKAAPGAVWPMRVAVNEMCDRLEELSPPKSLMPKIVWSWARPWANDASQDSGVAGGKAVVSR